MKKLFFLIYTFSFLITYPTFSQSPQKPKTNLSLNYGNFIGDKSFSLESYKTEVRLPFFIDHWSIINSFRSVYTKTDHNSSHYFDNNIYQISYALTITNRKYTILTFINSDSDKPFHSKDEIKPGAGIFREIYHSGKHSLALGLVYFKGELFKGYSYPFPFFGYSYLSNNLLVFLGLQNFILWKISPLLSFQNEYLYNGQFLSQIKFHLSKNNEIALQGGYENQAYSKAERQIKEEDISFQYYFFGLNYDHFFFSQTLKASIFSGYAFNAQYFRQKQSTLFALSSDIYDKVSIKNSLLIKFALSAIF